MKEIDLGILLDGDPGGEGLINSVRMRRSQPTNKNNPDIGKVNLRGGDLGVVSKVEGGGGVQGSKNKRRTRLRKNFPDRPQVTSNNVIIRKKEKEQKGSFDNDKRENLANQTVNNPSPVEHVIKNPLLRVQQGRNKRGGDIGGGTSKGSLQNQKKKQRKR